MYSLLLKTDFIAQHILLGPDSGPENSNHSHHYTFEIEISSQNLDKNNYLIDIIEIRNKLDNLIIYFKDKILNELPEFYNQNPSLEFFSKILWQKCRDQFNLPKSYQILVRLWEDAIAQASYREIKQCE